MAEKHAFGNRIFLSIDESTVEQDFHLMALVKRAGLDQVIMTEGEDPRAYAERLLDALLASETVLDILACLLVPADRVPKGKEPGECWSAEVASDTRTYLSLLRTAEDKQRIFDRVLSLLIGFFESGIVSLWTSAKSSAKETIPLQKGSGRARAHAMGSGRRSLSTSRKAIRSALGRSSVGRFAMPSRLTAGDTSDSFSRNTGSRCSNGVSWRRMLKRLGARLRRIGRRS